MTVHELLGMEAPDVTQLLRARDEVIRELTVRERCFPKWVEEGRLSPSDASDRLDRLTWAATELAHAVEPLLHTNRVTSTGDKTSTPGSV